MHPQDLYHWLHMVTSSSLVCTSSSLGAKLHKNLESCLHTCKSPFVCFHIIPNPPQKKHFQNPCAHTLLCSPNSMLAALSSSKPQNMYLDFCTTNKQTRAFQHTNFFLQFGWTAHSSHDIPRKKCHNICLGGTIGEFFRPNSKRWA